MNQILITKKLYITPELKKKKKVYKFNFIISAVLVGILSSAYIYAEYDRNKNEEVSQDILSNMKVVQDDTTISKEDDVWVVALDGNDDTIIEEEIAQENSSNSSSSSVKIGTYTASNGKTYNTVGSISIPSINVNYPILADTTDSLLKISVCKFWGPNPNEKGNLCIVGHNYRNSRFFSKVPKMVVGDEIKITDLSEKIVTYKVYDKYTVDPSDVSCTSQLTNGKTEVTLITCTDDSKQRVIVKARAV